jgi:hypothetical protein
MKGWDVLGGLVCTAVACGGDTVHLGTSTMGGSGSDSGGPYLVSGKNLALFGWSVDVAGRDKRGPYRRVGEGERRAA